MRLPRTRNIRHIRYFRLGLSNWRFESENPLNYLSYDAEAEVQQNREGGWASGTDSKRWQRKAYSSATQNPAQHPQSMGGSWCGLGCERCRRYSHPRKGG